MKPLSFSLPVAAGIGAAAVATLGAAPAVAQKDFGPDTCLVGFVWREAVPNDHVCVKPAVRDQAAADNARAGARVDPNAAPSCVNGYVWREAVRGDRVCVTPATRTGTRQDNALASKTRNSVRLIVTRDGGRFRIQVDHVNQGVVFVGLYSMNGTPAAVKPRPGSVHTRPSTLRPGGFINFLVSGPVPCAAGGPPNGYFRARDPISMRWSQRQNVRTCVLFDR
jgi:hypothetical protein